MAYTGHSQSGIAYSHTVVGATTRKSTTLGQGVSDGGKWLQLRMGTFCLLEPFDGHPAAACHDARATSVVRGRGVLYVSEPDRNVARPLTFADKTQMYPEMLPIQQMGMNTRLFALLPSHVSQELCRPDYLRFSLISMALGHSIRRTTDTDRQEAIARSFWANRGRVLSLLLAACQAQQTSDLFLAGVMKFLLTDVRIFDFVERISHHISFALTRLPKRYSTVCVLTFGVF